MFEQVLVSALMPGGWQAGAQRLPELIATERSQTAYQGTNKCRQQDNNGRTSHPKEICYPLRQQKIGLDAEKQGKEQPQKAYACKATPKGLFTRSRNKCRNQTGTDRNRPPGKKLLGPKA